MKRMNTSLHNQSKNLNAEEMSRYSRHIMLPQIGIKGQEQLKAAKVLCIGAGGLGSSLMLYLAAAGVGTIGIIDDDHIDISNLQRQVLYATHDLQQKKALVARDKLTALNPCINIIPYVERLTKDNALNIISQYDMVADGTDNFNTRFLINDACFHLKKINIYASIFQFEGQCSIFTAPNGPCYRCLYDEPPVNLIPNCAESGVLGVLPGLLGTLQANEVIKVILKIGRPLVGRLLTVNALDLKFQEFELPQNPKCRLCGLNQPFDTLPRYENDSCQQSVNHQPAHSLNAVNVQQLYSLIQEDADFILLDVREPEEYAICNLNGYLIPLNELPYKHQNLDKSKHIIVHCKSDARSIAAVKLLQNAGFPLVSYLAGGIQAWSEQIDTTMPRY